MDDVTLQNNVERSSTHHEQTGAASEHHRIPWITYAVIFLCTSLWAYLNFAENFPYYDDVVSTVAPRGFRIWTGAVWGLGWLVLCIILTYLDVLNIANAAHVGGFVFGLCVGMVFVTRTYVATCSFVLVLLAAMTVLSVTYMPWSEGWRSRHEVLEIVEIGEKAEAGDPSSPAVLGMALGSTKEKEKLTRCSVHVRYPTTHPIKRGSLPMTTQILEHFLYRCMLINLSLLLLSFILVTAFRPLVLKIHSRMFNVPEDYLAKAIHVFLSLYKFFTFFFFVIPWLALKIIT